MSRPESVAFEDLSEPVEEKNVERHDNRNMFKNQYWRYILRKTYEDYEELPETMADLLDKKEFMLFIEQLLIANTTFYDFNWFRRISKLTQLLEENQDVKIEDLESYKIDFSIWENQKELLKNLILSNQDLFQEEAEKRKNKSNTVNKLYEFH